MSILHYAQWKKTKFEILVCFQSYSVKYNVNSELTNHAVLYVPGSVSNHVKIFSLRVSSDPPSIMSNVTHLQKEEKNV